MTDSIVLAFILVSNGLLLLAILLAVISIERTLKAMATNSDTLANKIAAALDRAASSITRATTVLESGIKFVQEITPLMRQSADDADAVRALADAMDIKAQQFGEALAANTIAEGTEQPAAGSAPSVPVTTTPDTEPTTETQPVEGGISDVPPVSTPPVTDDSVTDEDLDAIEDGGRLPANGESDSAGNVDEV